VLADCDPSSNAQRWSLAARLPNANAWTAIRNNETGLCATAEIPPATGPMQVRLRRIARLVSQPCNGAAQQAFDSADAAWAQRNMPR
jgi:hypothetical protein